jgi:catechol 2,3-dioxygenase-like lactoylglutathione lyase family enzyme
VTGVETPVPALAGADHISLTVTNLDRSERFYTEILGLLRLADFGHVRILIHRQTSFLVGLIRHDATDGTPFTELNTGLDHLGFAASSRGELVEWERRFVARGVEHTPIRDMELGYHLNFRDPDNIALEITVSSDVAAQWFAELREQEIPRQEIDARLHEYLTSLEPAPTE